MLSASTATPLDMASLEENSSGRWLQPLRQGMKIMAVGAMLLAGRGEKEAGQGGTQ